MMMDGGQEPQINHEQAHITNAKHLLQKLRKQACTRNTKGPYHYESHNSDPRPLVHLCVEDETDVVHELVALVPLVANIFRMAHKLHTDRDVGTQQTVFRKTRQHWPTCRPKAATLIKCPVEEFYDLSTL